MTGISCGPGSLLAVVLHAIGLDDTDGNRLTEADPDGVGEHVVPPLQEYPSAHVIQCHAIERTLRSVFGTDHVSFATQSTTALRRGRCRRSRTRRVVWIT